MDNIKEHSGTELENLPVIAGINSAEAVRYLGTRALFMNSLGDFYRLIDVKANRLEQYLNEGLLGTLIIELHALKNTAKMIGAHTLSDEFARVEQYGNEGNLEALERELPAVMIQYRSFKHLLAPFGETVERDKRVVLRGDIIVLLQKLISAIDGFDLDTADMIFQQLEEVRLPSKCQTQMEYLRIYMADVALENIIATAGEMIKLV